MDALGSKKKWENSNKTRITFPVRRLRIFEILICIMNCIDEDTVFDVSQIYLNYWLFFSMCIY